MLSRLVSLLSRLVSLAAIAAVFLAASAHAADPTATCQSGKLKVAGKYASCLLSAESKAVTTNTSPDYSECDAKYSLKWQSTEAKAGAGISPGGDNDETAIQGFIDACDGVVADALAGGALPSDVVTCNDDLGTCIRDFGTCSTDLSAATTDLATCNGDLTTCNADLDACLPLAGCAFRGIVGDWVATLPDAPPNLDVCTLSISLTSANVRTRVTHGLWLSAGRDDDRNPHGERSCGGAGRGAHLLWFLPTGNDHDVYFA